MDDHATSTPTEGPPPTAAVADASSHTVRAPSPSPPSATETPTSLLRPLVEDLEARRAKAMLGGGEEKIAKQHEREKLTARERIALLIDAGTFVELGIHGRPHSAQRAMDGVEAPADGVITGYGKIDGRLAAVCAYDFTVMAGSMGMTGEIKVDAPARAGADQAHPVRVAARLRRRARAGGRRRDVRRLRAPLPRGGRGERGDPAGRRADGAVRRRHRVHPRSRRLRADGQGPRFDGARRSRTWCAPRWGRTSPRRNWAARACTAASRAWATWRSPTTRSASRGSRSTSPTCPRTAKRPRRYGWAGRRAADPIERAEEALLDVLPESNRKPYDMYDVIKLIVDDGDYLDIKRQWARTIITCFARFGGRPVGIVANQPRQLGGILDNDSADKAARFVNLCNAFGVPLLFIQDVPGFMVGTKVEAEGIIRHGAKMLYAVANATVPKITVITRKAYGAGYYVMNGRAYEPDLIVAWPSAEISVMGAEGVVEIAFRKVVEEAEDPAAKRAELIEGFRKQFDVYIAAGNDLVDDVIDPRETRVTICRALEMSQGKRVERPWKRHGVVPV